jgi:hypothetical protein
MDRVRCPTCGDEHDISTIEPYFDRPDEYFEIPVEQRAQRVWNARELCVFWETVDTARRHFMRAILPIPIRGEAQDYGWGIWVEVAEVDFAFTHDHWEDPAQAATAPFHGILANALPDMTRTRGLAGTVHLTGPDTLPRFILATDLDHPLVREQQGGVFAERIIEWAARAAHSADRGPAA